MITYVEDEPVPVKMIADLRRSVGWNGMEQSYNNPLMSSYYHIACYDDDALIGYVETVSNGVSIDIIVVNCIPDFFQRIADDDLRVGILGKMIVSLFN